MSGSLFDEFEGVSAKQWKQKIQMDLKGADYNDALLWQSPEGIHVKPFYHRDDAKAPFSTIPGQPDPWRIAQSVFIDDVTIANQLAIDAISRGAEAIYFSAEKEFEPDLLFSEFPFADVTIYFDLLFLAEEFMEKLQQFLTQRDASVHYNVDLLGNLARNGNWFHNLKRDHMILEKVTSQRPSQKIIGVDTTLYQNAGANTIQQLAYALAHANEYLNHFSQKKQPLPIIFKVAIGSNYFFEIAKLRALRILYGVLANEYGAQEECHIIAFPSKRNKTLYDYNLNMLRTTTECMSAILGGADTVCNLPYDGIYHKSNEFGERISRNQLLVLKAESYFDRVSNAADGSYYIESLTKEFAEKALELFKDIERNGGMLQQLKAGTIQKKIKESAQKEQVLFDEGTLVLVGTNKYGNDEDRMKENLELYPFVKMHPRQTIIEPIIEKRLAESLEKERLSHE
ncbi:MAG: methylmalonyl-CoA mutase subunit beta [Bacteroidota bacterium]